jgi:hypothetical protein
MAVFGAVEHKGNVVARVLDKVTREALHRFVHETVSTDVSLLSTDEHKGYNDLDKFYVHGRAHHTAHRYVIGAIHTNTIEGFWSLVKRGIVGSYHQVSRKYLPLYIAEFQFRYNDRLNPDIFGSAGSLAVTLIEIRFPTPQNSTHSRKNTHALRSFRGNLFQQIAGSRIRKLNQ